MLAILQLLDGRYLSKLSAALWIPCMHKRLARSSVICYRRDMHVVVCTARIQAEELAYRSNLLYMWSGCTAIISQYRENTIMSPYQQGM